jgi:hypothetical protein
MVEGIEIYPKFEEGADWNSIGTDYAKPPYPYSNFHGTWWGGNFRGVREYPVDLGEHQDQLVYSPHDYGPLVYAQTWFYDGFDKETLMEDVWYDNWFFIIEEKIAPLLMGEWGGFLDAEHDEDGKNRHWMACLRELMIENTIHHTFWCFNENSGDTGGLIAGGTNWTEWDEEKYEFVEPSLWQNEDGKFISLDHKIPLGKSGNGISLSEHYSGNGGITPPTTTAPQTTTTTPATTTAPATTTEPKTTAPTTNGSSVADGKKGDANCDGTADIADVVLAKCYLINPKAYSITEQGLANADVIGSGNGLEIQDVVAIQKLVLKLISSDDL